MEKNNEKYPPLPIGPFQDRTTHLIKVIGVGGGGSNAVKNMYEKGVKNVSFAICNTDSQALSNNVVPMKLQLGNEGLGVGGYPERGRQAALDSLDDIQQLFDDETRMVFITAGMGGGTGTGAAPVIAQAAREKGILTVGVVTLPFKFEKRNRIEKALMGVEEMKRNVDAILVINNERLMEIYADGMTTFPQAFAKADEVLTTATKSIAEVITVEGIVNRDFRDVETVMKDGGGCIMAEGRASGDNRIMKAMQQAIQSPLVNNLDIQRARRLLYIIYSGSQSPVTISESREINEFMDTLSGELEVLWGLYPDESLQDEVRVTIVATGFDQEPATPTIDANAEHIQAIQALMDFYYPKRKAEEQQRISSPEITDKQEQATIDTEMIVADNPQFAEEEDVSAERNPRESRAQAALNWFVRLCHFIKSQLEEDS